MIMNGHRRFLRKACCRQGLVSALFRQTGRKMTNDTIYALSSGAGAAGVAVVRVSGPRAGEVLRLLSGRKLPQPRRAVLRMLRDPEDEALIDKAMVLWMPCPASFTGEDVVEFHVHGGRATVRRLLSSLDALEELRPAEAGEFTRRAFENGRMDLVEVEGLADLVRAETEAQRRQALAGASGSASRKIGKWREDLIHVLSSLEAAIDFVEEEDVAIGAMQGVQKRLQALVRDMEEVLQCAERAEKLREGIRVVIAGPPNAGKSSLLNHLAGREAAIVSQEAGTTRDVIEVRLDLDGMPVVLSDTAGLRGEPSGMVERMGQDRALERMREADLVLWLEAPDAHGEPPVLDSCPLRILNKVDLLDSKTVRSIYDLHISVLQGTGMGELEERLSSLIRDRYEIAGQVVLTRERQARAVRDAWSRLSEVLEQLDVLPLELCAEQVRMAVQDLERLVGRVDVEALLDRIFRDFCIGK